MPVSVLEAMSIGLVPVLSNIQPHEEVARNCKFIHTTPLMEKNWIGEIKEYQLLMDSDRKSLSNNIVNSVRQNFSLEKMHRRYNEIYEILAK